MKFTVVYLLVWLGLALVLSGLLAMVDLGAYWPLAAVGAFVTVLMGAAAGVRDGLRK